MPILYMLVGCPGSGKSTWSAKQIELNSKREKPIVYVSRDAIRFSMVGEDKPYFSREKDVFREYVRQIQKGLSSGHNVIADATHLHEMSRNKLLDRLDLTDVEVCPIVFAESFEVCSARNSLRTGRAKVRQEILESMYDDFTIPTTDEKYQYSHIFAVHDDIYTDLT